MTGYKLTPEQANELNGQQYAENCSFDPIQDINGAWFIFEREIIDCINPQFQWVKQLPQEEYTAPVINK